MKKSPDSFIQTGYYLEKAVYSFEKNLSQALECMTQGVRDAKANGDDVSLFDLWRIRAKIFSIMASAQVVRKIHKKLAKLIEQNGYAPITDEDFKRFGVLKEPR